MLGATGVSWVRHRRNRAKAGLDGCRLRLRGTQYSITIQYARLRLFDIRVHSPILFDNPARPTTMPPCSGSHAWSKIAAGPDVMLAPPSPTQVPAPAVRPQGRPMMRMRATRAVPDESPEPGLQRPARTRYTGPIRAASLLAVRERTPHRRRAGEQPTRVHIHQAGNDLRDAS
jgi:hypothetical protein